jgi:hypothetical protein
MSVKISELQEITLANLSATANTAVPMVSDVLGSNYTYRTSVANIKSYVSNNITATGLFTATGISTFQSNVVVQGNLSVQGTTTTTSSQNLSTNASIIEMHTFDSTLDPWTVNDGRDIGLRMYYFGTSANTAALYRESSNGFLTWVGAGAGNVTGNISTSATFGTMQLGAIWIANSTPTTGARTGALQVNGGAYIGGDIWSGGAITTLGDYSTIGNITSDKLQINSSAIIGGSLSSGTLTVNNSVNAGTTIVAGGAATVNALTVNTIGVFGTTIQAANVQASVLLTVNNTATIGGNLLTSNIYPTTSNVSNIGSSAYQYNNVFAKATSAQYADLAEKYLADAEYEPGTVVVFGGGKEITVTDMYADNRVAGVVSTDPAYLMNSLSEGLPIALRGKVPVKVVGAVRKGDLLVTSTCPGYAESLGFREPKPYTVVAKSLEESASTEARTIIAVIL